MTDMFKALMAASQGLAKKDIADLVLGFAEHLTREPEELRRRVASGVTALLGVIVPVRAPSTGYAAAVGSPKGRGKSPFFIREVLEYDPTVFNGWSITKGAFIPNLPAYTGNNLLMFATRGDGAKLIAFGKRDDSADYPFTYPSSGKSAVIKGFSLIRECKSWPEAHDHLAASGCPHGVATPLKKATAT